MEKNINKIFRAAASIGVKRMRVLQLLQDGSENSVNILKGYLSSSGFGALRAKQMIEDAMDEAKGLPPAPKDVNTGGTKAPNLMGYNTKGTMTSKSIYAIEPPKEPEEPEIEKSEPEEIPIVWKKASELREPDYEEGPEDWYKYACQLVDELGSIAKMCDFLKISRTTFYNRKKEALADSVEDNKTD